MKFIYVLIITICGCAAPIAQVASQSSVLVSKDFKLGSPFSEPDGRNDIVKISNTDFVTLAKVKGNQSGKSDFMMERYDANLNSLWQVPLSVETFEDYKDLYFSGKELVLLSVIHKESEKKTVMEAYGYDVNDGKKLWTKELESYQVEDWETHPHKGRVKESFVDLVCEHVNQDFVTPFEYKHNISFSPDHSKFVSYVYNYGESNLTASVSVYDNAGNLLKRGKVAIDNDYTNYGICINSKGETFILNCSNSGKVNFIKFDMETKDFVLLDLPPSNYQKDDFHVQFVSDDIAYVGNSEVKDGKIYGVMYSKFNFKTQKVEASVYEEFDAEFKAKIVQERKNNKQIKGNEDWLDYDITHFTVDEKEQALIILEKRALHADGYPHIGKDAFDKSHKVEFNGHVQAETVIMVAFDQGKSKWKNFLLKNQVYPATDGLNTISFIIHDNVKSEIRFLFATSEGLDGVLHVINLVAINPENGSIIKSVNLPNENKLTLVREYSLFTDDNSLVVVGKKGVLGKASMIVKYKL